MADTAKESSSPARQLDTVEKTTEKDMESIDMTIKDEHTEQAADFSNESPMPNIWSIGNGEEDGEPVSSEENSNASPTILQDEDNELERPSFLRRLSKRRQKDDNTDKDQN